MAHVEVTEEELRHVPVNTVQEHFETDEIRQIVKAAPPMVLAIAQDTTQAWRTWGSFGVLGLLVGLVALKR